MPTPPTSTPWVPMWPFGGAPIPTPVNDKWLRTVGGAMVWADITGKRAATVSAANTDLAAPTYQFEQIAVNVNGGTLRSLGAGTVVGQQVTIQNVVAGNVLIKHTLAGGAGAQLWMRSLQDMNLRQWDTITFYWDGTTWVEIQRNTSASIANVLPGTPYDGQEAYLCDNLVAPSFTWKFRYNAAYSGSEKWEFIGGSPFLASVAGLVTRTSLTYGDMSGGADLTFTAPRAGFYDIGFGGHITGPGAGAPNVAYGSIQVGGGAASDTDLIAMGENGGTNVNLQVSPSRIVRKSASASEVIKPVWRGDNASGAFSLERRWMTVTPVRVS